MEERRQAGECSDSRGWRHWPAVRFATSKAKKQ